VYKYLNEFREDTNRQLNEPKENQTPEWNKGAMKDEFEKIQKSWKSEIDWNKLKIGYQGPNTE
jgi:hypothetical protein